MVLCLQLSTESKSYELAGDNFRGFVNPADGTRGYHDNGAFNYSDDRFTRISGAAFDNSKNANTSYWYGEYGNFAWDPTNYNKFYSPVGSELWVTENGGAGFELVNDFGGDKIISVKVSPLDPNRIYVSHKHSGSSWRIHTSADGGETWENVSMSSFGIDFNTNKAIYLDVDGNGKIGAFTDGFMVLRKMFGDVFDGDALTHKVLPDDATRTTDEIHEYIASLTTIDPIA